ncbi:unnamed protein product [Dovyalis caffra]|uniref:Uncharacterized protein n=1 Tax=Dovyalis caffra TaxID=77055 RepID=A0AAV1QWK5_9ROSI|nr:unnamed protein product [Dovyalis caffra]
MRSVMICLTRHVRSGEAIGGALTGIASPLFKKSFSLRIDAESVQKSLESTLLHA